MFQEVCLSCSKLLDGDGQTYCSDECSQLDAVSPSISSSSSVFSSPSINYAVGGEVPALVPSALGSALGSYRARDRYSLSSSSASSVSWSALTDEEEDINVGVEDESSMFNGNPDAYIYEGSSKSSSLVHVAKSAGSSGLSYARRPSTTNHRSTIPSLHRRTSSSSSSGLAPGVPQSATSGEDDSFSAVSSEFLAEHDFDLSDKDREQEGGTVSQKPKRTRNRASLPAYFSLLQVSSPHRSSPISTSVGSRASPPTPKLAFATGTMTCASKVKSFISVSGSSPAMQATPRGRLREAGTSRSRSWQSRSRSRSRPAQLQPESRNLRDRMDSRSSVEKVFDWSCPPAVRGRTAVRRNSSPLPKMLLSTLDFDGNTSARSGSENHTRTRTRGRIAVDELEGIGFSTEAPGFGVGRSGLLNREREVHPSFFPAQLLTEKKENQLELLPIYYWTKLDRSSESSEELPNPN
ncbi:hypothetical protein PILCRDRAFT_90031 [Piloderma croceum F 1598]|uniref:Uncharacterized protein n=1 Tax=Piloderma croceum (strain F 1598) TaxID=765440 RepID=A0A0C3B0B6_PILCF|nr:hypothetical protein PILCRDRAFT_90031 [Piloderma croceum F 1598]